MARNPSVDGINVNRRRQTTTFAPPAEIYLDPLPYHDPWDQQSRVAQTAVPAVCGLSFDGG
jgi:hypothetical protein